MRKLLLLLISVCSNLLLFGQDDLALEYQHMQDSIKGLWSDPSLYFPQTKFVKVVGYTYNRLKLKHLEDQDYSIIDFTTKQLAKSVDSLHFVLTTKQVDTLLKILNDTSTFEWGMSACFHPHHAFIFYNDKNLPVAHIDICFMCYTVDGTPPTPIMREGHISETGLTYLSNFCKLIGMPKDTGETIDTNEK